MNRHLRLRTVFVGLLLAGALTVGGLLSFVTYQTNQKNMQDSADRLATQISQSSISNLISVNDHIERDLSLLAVITASYWNKPDFTKTFYEAWMLHKHGNGSNHGMSFVESATGNGIIVGNSELETVENDGHGNFTAKSRKNGVTRPLEDLRNTKWYKKCISNISVADDGWTPLGYFSRHSRLKQTLGVSGFRAVRSPDDPTKVLGVLSIQISTDWIHNNLVESVATFVVPAKAFILERGTDGINHLVAHFDAAIQKKIRDKGLLLQPSELDCPITVSIANHIPLDIQPDSKPIHQRIETPEGVYFTTFSSFASKNSPQLIMCYSASESLLMAPARKRLFINLLITLVVAIVIMVPTILFAMAAARPLEALTRIANATGRLELTALPPLQDSGIYEVDQLATATKSMQSGLKAFLRYIPPDLIHRYLRPEGFAQLDGEMCHLTILFSDIKDFSSISEKMQPMALVRQLNEYLETISKQIAIHNGTLDKYIGDAVMSFWNAPNNVPRHAREACAATLNSRKPMRDLFTRWNSEGLPLFYTRVGIHTGNVIVGNIGSSVRLNYTIIGDAVNLASRLEGLNKTYGTKILISEVTRDEAGGEFLTRPVDRVAVKGKSLSVQVYELMEWRVDASNSQLELVNLTTLALAAYQSRRFVEAVQTYQSILEGWPDDTLAMIMLERAKQFVETPPDQNWDGVYYADHK